MYIFREDCLIKNLNEIYSSCFGYPSKGTFVEVGASDGWYQSNSYGLIKHGWKGIYIEPIKWMYDLSVNYFKDDLAFFENVSVGTQNKNVLFYEDNVRSTADVRYQQINNLFTSNVKFSPVWIPQVSLDSILLKYSVRKNFELLIVDANDATEDIFNSFSLTEYSPKYILCCMHKTGYTQYISFYDRLVEEKYNGLKNYINSLKEKNVNVKNKLLNCGYTIWYQDDVNVLFKKL